jgi:hypothetical protein
MLSEYLGTITVTDLATAWSSRVPLSGATTAAGMSSIVQVIVYVPAALGAVQTVAPLEVVIAPPEHDHA